MMNKPNLTLVSQRANEQTLHRLTHNLNTLMSERNIDGVSLSKLIGVPVTTINRLRNINHLNNPTLSTLLPIAAFFRISLSQLLGDEPLISSEPAALAPTPLMDHYQVPIKRWEDMAQIKPSQTTQSMHTHIAYSSSAFALQVTTQEWLDFPQNTLLLVEPKRKPHHKDYVIALKKGQTIPSLKRYLADEDQIYLQSLSVGQHVAHFDKDYTLYGVVAESRRYFE